MHFQSCSAGSEVHNAYNTVPADAQTEQAVQTQRQRQHKAQ